MERQTGISNGNIARWLNDEGAPTLDMVDRVAAAFKVSPSEFLGDQKPTPSRIPPDILEMLMEATPDHFKAIRLTLEGFGLGKEKRTLTDKAKKLRHKA